MVTYHWTALHSRFQAMLKQRSLLAAGQKILVAFSGGQDSRCLLQLLCDLQAKWQWQLAIAHCDHRWPPDSGANADHAEQVATQLQLPYFGPVAPTVLKGEAEGRDWRYQMLVNIAQQHQFPTVVTAHTASDRAETFLFNLIRGSGTDGLQALTWTRPLSDGIQLVRPILNITRSETGVFCQEQGLPIWTDQMNQDLHYSRNRMRQAVLPYLREHFNPKVEGAIARTAELLQADVSYLEMMAQNLLQTATVTLSDVYLPSGAVAIAQLQRAPLQTAPLALQRRAIRQFLQLYLHRTPTFAQIEKVTALLTAPNRSRTDPLEGQIVAEVSRPYLCLVRLGPVP